MFVSNSCQTMDELPCLKDGNQLSARPAPFITGVVAVANPGRSAVMKSGPALLPPALASCRAGLLSCTSTACRCSSTRMGPAFVDQAS